MKVHRFEFAVEKMCQVFKVSRSGFYHWLNRKPSSREQEKQVAVNLIKAVYQKSKNRYGAPKIAKEIQRQGYLISRPRVARLMRCEGIRSIIKKKFRVVTTDSRHNYATSPNLLDRNFKVDLPAKAWVSDITYIPTLKGWLYLTIIMDLFDRKIVGWSLSTNMTAEDTVLNALKMASVNRSPSKGLIFHSDRGIQYACTEFRRELKNRFIQQSMSRKGDCWDNAVAESFFKILKSELVKHHQFNSIMEAKMKVFEFIEIWYNRERIHEYLGYLSPENYLKQFYLKVA